MSVKIALDAFGFKHKNAIDSQAPQYWLSIYCVLSDYFDDSFLPFHAELSKNILIKILLSYCLAFMYYYASIFFSNFKLYDKLPTSIIIESLWFQFA